MSLPDEAVELEFIDEEMRIALSTNLKLIAGSVERVCQAVNKKKPWSETIVLEIKDKFILLLEASSRHIHRHLLETKWSSGVYSFVFKRKETDYYTFTVRFKPHSNCIIC